MAKCGRLPKLIVAIGERCRASKGHKRIPLLKNLNNHFMDRLETDSRYLSLRGLFSWMQAYFDALSDALKPCVFYLSVFSADYNIRRKRLLRRWIAEGYSRENIGISTKEDGEILFFRAGQSEHNPRTTKQATQVLETKRLCIKGQGWWLVPSQRFLSWIHHLTTNGR